MFPNLLSNRFTNRIGRERKEKAMEGHVSDKKIFAAILAAGSGERMKISETPKQYLFLEDKPIIIHTLEKFLLIESFDAICVGISLDWENHFKSILEQYVDRRLLSRVKVVIGGRSRSHTIEKIIHYLEDSYKLGDEDILVTHDAVRPFVSLRIIKENIEMVSKFDMIDTVIPAHDTIVVSEDGEQISDIPLRPKMFHGQTPQTFKIRVYSRLYGQLGDEERASLTDACKVFVLREVPVGLVRGDEANIKITTVKDFRLAMALIGEKQ